MLRIVNARNIDPLSDLRDAELIWRKNQWFFWNPISEACERLTDGAVCVAIIMRNEVPNVLEHYVFRAFRFEDPGNLKEKGSPDLVHKAFPLTGLAERLARESCAKNFVVRNVFILYIADVDSRVDPVILFVNRDYGLIDVGRQNALATELGHRLMESSYAGEEVYKFKVFLAWQGITRIFVLLLS